LVKATKDEQEYSPFSVLTNVQTQACLEDYLATWKQINFTKNTTKHYAALFEEWFKYNTNIPLEDSTTQMVEKYMQNLVVERKPGSSLHKITFCVNKFYLKKSITRTIIHQLF